ncbi:GerAB/ArcD/ProY family transporter [Paenibacillus puerhi]|uniref:GerAB/ArcD/ProY family transporter n=1 Tax=Paenibacillus puerhi TaxID=2692622 RepID=UPI00135BA898|nr:endospore germination permease [Paenibacillus puerhi]
MTPRITTIGSRQLTILASLLTMGDSILISPGIISSIAGQDAWFSVIIGNILGLLLITLYLSLTNRYPQQHLIEICESVFGRWGGRIIAVVCFLLLWLIVVSMLLREIGDFLTTQIMPETPVQAIYVVVIIVMICGLRLGLEPVARTAEIFFPWVLVLFLMLVCFVSTEIDFRRLQPYLNHDASSLLRGSLPILAFPFCELSILFAVFPSVTKTRPLGKYLYSGVILGGIVLLIVILTCTLVLGADIVQRSNYPSYIMAKKISIGNFLERLEVLMAIMWMLTIYFKIALTMYALVTGTAYLFNIRDYRPLLLPFGLITIILAQLLAPNIIAYNQFTGTIYPMIVGIMFILLPLLLRIIPRRRKLGGM